MPLRWAAVSEPLEARWAYFFDMVGLRFQYEPEGYDLDGVWYVPDFYLPTLACWVEIKGEEPSEAELVKVRRLAAASQKPAYLFVGISEDVTGAVYVDDEWMDEWQQFGECVDCGHIGISFEARTDKFSCCPAASEKGFGNSELIRRALATAEKLHFSRDGVAQP